MTAFWISTGLLTLLVLAVLCWPLLRRHGGAGASRKAINTAIYRDQLAELERDLASGVLSQADYGSARDELERRVLEDVAAAEVADAAPLTPRRLPRTALALAVTLPLAAAVLYVVLGTPAALDPAAREGQQASAAEIEKMVDALAAKLEKDPGNLEGWAMLGRSYMVTGRFADAAKAFDKAGAAMEASSEMMLQVAELSAELNQGRVDPGILAAQLNVAGSYTQLLSSDDAAFGGSGVKNGAVRSKKKPAHGYESSIEVTLPGLSSVYFAVPAKKEATVSAVRKAKKPAVKVLKTKDKGER